MGNQLVYLPEPITEKDIENGGDIDKCGSRYGVCGMQGWRRNMEDSHLALPDFDSQIGLYGVFDGHGGRGVARYAAKMLPKLLRDTDAYKSADYSSALEQAFLAIDEKLREPEGRTEVAELDQPDPGAPSRPIAVPRAMLRHILREQKEEPAEAKESSPVAADGRKTQKGWGIRRRPPKEPALAKCPAVAEDEKENSGSAVPADDAKPDAACVTNTTGAKVGEDGNADVQAPAKERAEASSAEVTRPKEELEDGTTMVDPSRLMRNSTPEAQGCTAVVVLLVHDTSSGDLECAGPRLYCANAGDSRAIASRLGHAVALSEDQKPENASETARIEKAGGFVKKMPAGGARLQGDLNLSRAMGDLRHKKPEHLPPAEQILSAFPEVRCFPVTSEHEFLVLGCDGIWERATNQEMVDFVRERLCSQPAGHVGTAASGDALPLSEICGDACDKGICKSMGENVDGTGADNMTMMIVQLARTVGQSVHKRPAEDAADGDAPAAKAQKVGD